MLRLVFVSIGGGQGKFNGMSLGMVCRHIGYASGDLVSELVI